MPCQHFSSPPDGDGFRLGVDGVHRLVDQHRVPVEWVGLSGDEHSVEEGQGNVGQFAGDGGDEFLSPRPHFNTSRMLSASTTGSRLPPDRPSCPPSGTRDTAVRAAGGRTARTGARCLAR